MCEGAVDATIARCVDGRVHDVARFLPDDPEPLFLASFSCPTCLSVASIARVGERVVTCSCLPCGTGWEVGLTAMQEMRLVLGPPRALPIVVSGSLPL